MPPVADVLSIERSSAIVKSGLFDIWDNLEDCQGHDAGSTDRHGYFPRDVDHPKSSTSDIPIDLGKSKGKSVPPRTLDDEERKRLFENGWVENGREISDKKHSRLNVAGSQEIRDFLHDRFSDQTDMFLQDTYVVFDNPNDESEKELPRSERAATRKSKMEKILELRDENKSLKRRVRDYQKRSRRSTANDGTKDHMEAIKALSVTACKQLETLQAQRDMYSALEKELAEVKSECSSMKKAKETDKKEISRLTKEVQTLAAETFGLQQELARSLEQAVETEKSSNADQSENATLNKQLEDQRRRVHELEAKINARDDEIDQLKIERLAMKRGDQCESEKSDLEGKITRIVSLELELENLTDAMAELQALYGKEREVRLEQGAELKRAASEAEKSNKELSDLREDLISLVNENEALRRRLLKSIDDESDRVEEDQKEGTTSVANTSKIPSEASSKAKSNRENQYIKHAPPPSDAQDALQHARAEAELLEQKLLDMSKRNEHLSGKVDELESVKMALEDKIGKMVSLELEMEDCKDEMEQSEREFERKEVEHMRMIESAKEENEKLIKEIEQLRQ